VPLVAERAGLGAHILERPVEQLHPEELKARARVWVERLFSQELCRTVARAMLARPLWGPMGARIHTGAVAGLDISVVLRTFREGAFPRLRRWGWSVWPEVTIRAGNQEEVDCLLHALAQAGVSCLLGQGFRVEVGGANTAQILRAVETCLTEQDIDSVGVVLRTGREHVLKRQPTA
jgi:hypothetical protein